MVPQRQEASEVLKSARPHIHRPYLSVEEVAGATLAGSDGYLHKGVKGEELLEAPCGTLVPAGVSGSCPPGTKK